MNFEEEMRLADARRQETAELLISNGEIIHKTENSSEYVGVCITKVLWDGKEYDIIEIDGAVSRIEQDGNALPENLLEELKSNTTEIKMS